MSDIKNLTRTQAQEKLATIQEKMGSVMSEAKQDDGSTDFNKVTVFGGDVKGSIAVAEKFNQLNAEANELGGHIETLMSSEKAAREYEEREKGKRNFTHPGAGGGNAPANVAQFKSLGEQAIESKAFKSWLKSGAVDGLTLPLEDQLPSDFLAKAARFDTIGTKALMTTAAGYAPEVVRIPGFVEAPTRPLQLLDILPTGTTAQSAVQYMEETTRTHAAAETAEGASFAESTFVFTESSTPVVKITDSVPVTDEQLEDVAMIESYINGRLAFGVRQRLDTQCMVGNGTAPNLRGILNTTGIQTQAKGSDPAMDAFYKAMTKTRLIGRAMPSHVCMHPNDWQGIRLTRTTDGIYILGNPNEAGVERLWGLPVVQNDAMSEGTGLVGSFEPSWIMLFERRGIDIQVGYVNAQFGQGRRTVRADMRGALMVGRPAAFCTVTGV